MFQRDALVIRILAGTNMFFSSVGAISEIVTRDEHKQEFANDYDAVLRKMLNELGWDDVPIYKRVYSRGIIMAIPTEFDLTYAACKILGIAFEIAATKYNKTDELDFAEELEYLEYIISKERHMTLRNIYNEAKARLLNVYLDQNIISIGSGKGAYIANIDEIACDDIPWGKIYEIPSVMVTGTNGKTTTVRLTSFISQHAGKCVGYCSTDWVMINGEVVSEGDLSGPHGNRRVMTNPDVDVAVLEVARGGIVKRGLATSNVDGAVVMNVSEDHLGVNGIDDVMDLARAKFTVQNAVRPGGHNIVNLDDEISCSFIDSLPRARAFFSQKLAADEVIKFIKTSDDYACFIEDNKFMVYRHGEKHVIAKVNDVDLTYNGIAKHNIENVLAAICLSVELGRSYAEITAGLHAFRNDEHNHGRFNMFDVKGFKDSKIFVDYGHNFASVDNMLKFARSIANADTKITVLLGLSGDRKFMVDKIANSVVQHKIDYVIVKMFTNHLRGAEVGELAEFLQERLLKRGFDTKNIVATVDQEIEALGLVLANMEANHLYIMLCQDQAAEVINAIKKYNNEANA
jgi:UDP-N-acetylmuramate-alanine ligase